MLVAAHQLVVGKLFLAICSSHSKHISGTGADLADGSNELPPVALRPEGEVYQAPLDDETPRVEQGDAFSDSLGLSRAHSATSSSSAAPSADARPTELADLSSAGKKTESDATPHALQGKEPSTVPDLVLTPDDGPSEYQIEQAMSESVHNVSEQAAPSTVPSPKKAKPSKPQNSGADLILPIIIYAVVRANPPQLASHLMYLRRYRSAICLTGEVSYAMVDVTAVVEFLEHVDLAELGLGGDSDKVMSIADLSPIGLDYLDEGNADAQSIASASSRLRGRVFQVGEMAGSAAGSANKVITGVLDSSWTAMRGLISSPPNAANNGVVPVQPRPTRARQASTFSLASTVASIAAAATTAAQRSRAGSRASEMVVSQHPGNGQQWQGNQELMEVASRPESIRETADDGYTYDFHQGGGPEHGHFAAHESEDRELEDRPEAEEDDLVMPTRSLSDARSIRSVASGKSRDMRKDDSRSERVSLSDRLANIGSLGRVGSGTDLQAAVAVGAKEPSSKASPAPPCTRITHPDGKLTFSPPLLATSPVSAIAGLRPPLIPHQARSTVDVRLCSVECQTSLDVSGQTRIPLRLP